MCSQVLASTNAGFGRHHNEISPSKIELIQKLAITTSSTYSYGLALAKMSFAVLYIRMLPDRRLIIINKVIIVFLCCQAIEESLIPIFQCQPIAKAWAPGMAGQCLDLPVLWWVGFAFNLCTDLILFIQPVPTLWKLQLPLIKRLGLIAMLSLGILVCAISIIRMHSVTKMGLDSTHDLAIPIIWSEAEVSTLIVCSCVPSLRKVVQKIPCLNRAFEMSETDVPSPVIQTIGQVRNNGQNLNENSNGKGGFGQESELTGTTLTYPMSVLSQPTRSYFVANEDTGEIRRAPPQTTICLGTHPATEQDPEAHAGLAQSPSHPHLPPDSCK
ncbi:uncharacterized protein CTRU02_210394 [Colletotrichum truncatum]|uniref:Integral membrane protein n=1 Tax=Colletotrichum truncatum TaxID=5467 RepID=A0ACC3YNV9_COLTU